MERREFLHMAAVSAVGSRLTGSAQTDDRFEELAKLVQSKMAEHHIPGVSFGVLKNGKTTVIGSGVLGAAALQKALR